ncbi:MAG: hypothetical protein HUU34_04625 [Saprospiraceae bacterium]|jgi:hypothetical protein|nr:hypothetical protein [Saprospiraceae bacterium]
MQAADYIRKLISINRTDAALAFLHEISGQLAPEVNEEVVLHAANYARLQQDKIEGTLSKQDEKLLFTQLHNALLYVAGALPPHIEAPVAGIQVAGLDIQVFLLRYRLPILLALWGLVILSALWLQSKPKPDVPVRLDLTLNRLAFTAKESTDFEVDQSISTLQISQFGTVSLPARRLRISDQEGNARSYDVSEGQIELSPANGNDESGFILDHVFLQSIAWEAHSRVTLTMPENQEEAGGVIALDIQSGKAAGVLNFQDSLAFECSQLEIKGLNEALSVDWASGVLFVPPGEAAELHFSGRSDNLSLLLESTENNQPAVEKQHLPIDSVAFIRPLGNGEFTSSILRADIQFVDKKNQPYRRLSLKSGEFLKLASAKALEIVSIQWHENAIQVQLAGRAGLLSAGPTLDTLQIQNPGYISWWWQFHPLQVIAVVVLLTGLTTASRLTGKR